MKVFFTASQRGKKSFEEYYQQIYQIVEKLGYKHLDDTLIKLSMTAFYTHLKKGGKRAHIDFYRKNIKCLKEADINIFESSLPSLSVGYMIEKSLEMHKPTAILYFENNAPYFLTDTGEEKLIVRNYTEKNLPQVVKEALDLARLREDKRFNFFISPYLLSYLDKVSKEQGITKSNFIRKLLLEHMKKAST